METEFLTESLERAPLTLGFQRKTMSSLFCPSNPGHWILNPRRVLWKSAQRKGLNLSIPHGHPALINIEIGIHHPQSTSDPVNVFVDGDGQPREIDIHNRRSEIRNPSNRFPTRCLTHMGNDLNQPLNLKSLPLLPFQNAMTDLLEFRQRPAKEVTPLISCEKTRSFEGWNSAPESRLGSGQV